MQGRFVLIQLNTIFNFPPPTNNDAIKPIYEPRYRLIKAYFDGAAAGAFVVSGAGLCSGGATPASLSARPAQPVLPGRNGAVQLFAVHKHRWSRIHANGFASLIDARTLFRLAP